MKRILKNLLEAPKRIFLEAIYKFLNVLKRPTPGLVERRGLNKIFLLRDSIFFRKKKPYSEAYPFTVVDPFEVFGDNNLYGDFNLVGDDWTDKGSGKPVAILWGFNNWKWGFASAYLPEYRTAFAPRKILWWPSLRAIRRFPLKPEAFVFWGYTESRIVKWYAQRNDIKIFRMEDGFIRSASLGASHSTPYSLLLDAKGLHYNPEEVSDIEEILNTHAFSEEELESAERCLHLMQSLKLSKYNPPSLVTENQNIIKIRKRVAVLGQVDNDMSVRLGNPDRWSMVELIRLAKLEHPDADILYRAHPDVYRGYQRSAFRKRAVDKICELTSPDVPLIEFLDTVDHVYTITSLSGLEALLRGKNVTVVGAAFYAGWGLTDDRIEFPRRTTKRTLLEMFASIYLKYPRYLANLEDSEIGLQAALLRVKADYEIEKYKLFNLQKADTDKNIRTIAQSDYWPQLLFKKQTKENEELVQKAINHIDFEDALSIRPERMFQIVFIYSICGIYKSNYYREIFINAVRHRVDPDIFNLLLLDLSKYYPGEYIATQFAWLLTEANEKKASLDILMTELVRSQDASLRLFKEANETVNLDTNVKENQNFSKLNDIEKPSISMDQAKLLLEMFDQNFSMRNFDAAIDLGKKLLLAGYFVSKIIQRMAKLSAIKFDYVSAKNIAKFGQNIDLYEQNRILALVESRSFTESMVSENKLSFVESLVKLIVLKPDKIAESFALIEKFSNIFENERLAAVFAGILLLDNEQSIRKSAGFIAIEKPLLALRIIENLISQGNHLDSLRIAYSQALSYADRLEESMKVMDDARKLGKTSANYRETLRLYVLAGMYEQSFKLLKDAQKRKIELGDMYPRKIYFGNRMVKEALETFTELAIKKIVETYYPDKYFYTGSQAFEIDKLIILAIFGPGDEIRFSSIYNLLPTKLVQKNLTISCEPRLLNLFARSFENLHFLAVPRPRDSESINLKSYTNVLGSDLIRVIDNKANDAINSADQIMLVTDMLHICLPDYEAFPGKAYLKNDESLTKYYRNQLPTNIKLIGLSWRSSLATHSRNEHYLTVEELEPIFKIAGLQFVNFQYDECQRELDWIEKRYPGKLINIAEIDHYNDFDSVAALMKCMDLIVGPLTTVMELAGALGCPSWLLSNSSELHWRKIDQYGTDVWHNSMNHIEASILGDKIDLVNCLYVKLAELSTNALVNNKNGKSMLQLCK